MRSLLCLICLVVSVTVLGAPDRQTLESRIYAVHATSVLPQDGVLTAGLEWPDSVPRELKGLLPRVRYTLHFSLGELVRPVGDWKSWESCQYAVVTPLRDLSKSLLNINCYDTFILGDFHFSRDTVLVLPYGNAKVSPRMGRLHRYDPQRQTLRQAVDECIENAGGWSIEMNDGIDEDLLKEALFEGRNINTPAFFDALLRHYPYVSMGLRFHPLDGEHYRLSELEGGLLNLTSAILGLPFSQGVVHSEELEELTALYSEWRGSMEGSQLSASAIRALLAQEAELESWSRLGRAEIALNEHGLSLYGLKLKQLRDILIAAYSDDALQAAIDNLVK